MCRIGKSQRGGSALGNLVILAVAAYGIFIGIQYVPQLMESRKVDSVLDSIQGNYRFGTAAGPGEVESMIDTQLNLNQALDLKNSFKITQNGSSYIITVAYDRELDLLFSKKTIHYGKTLTLD